MQEILANKWLILALLEVTAWTCTFFMMYARYRLQSSWLFKLGMWLTVCTGVIPQVTLGIINFVTERELDFFTVMVVGLIVYAATFGRKKIKRLDQWAQRKLSKTQ